MQPYCWGCILFVLLITISSALAVGDLTVDNVVNIENSREAKTLNPKIELIEVEGGEHRFGNRMRPGEWEEKIKNLIQKDEWIMDGNYQPTLELRLSRADAIIFMDTPRLVCIIRLIKRRLTKPKTEIAPGCVERLDRKFMSYIWRYEKTQRPKIIKLLEKYKGEKEIYVIHSKKEMWSFLKTLPKSF